MNGSFEDQENFELVSEGMDCEGGRAESLEAAIAESTRCELFEGGLGI